ncbi:MAG: HD domain-containing phosphohydrolase [Planctomycetaceae bacterium]
MTLLESAGRGLESEGCAAGPDRLISASEIRLSEIMSAFSLALDLTQGYPQGHCMRTALIGMRLANELRLPLEDSSALYYALLLKDLGCSSNAAKIAYLFAADDQAVKYATRLIDWTKPGENLRHCWNQCEPEGSLWNRMVRMWGLLRGGPEVGREISQIRCERGADIARRLQLSEATARAIYELDEHWDGRGTPQGLKGEEISLPARICCLAQTVEVYVRQHDVRSTCDIARERCGTWFDPALVDALETFEGDASFWTRLYGDNLVNEVMRSEPEGRRLLADEDCLDQVAQAFAMVVDAKSPWTYQHSTRVATIALGVARQLGCTQEFERDLHRAALLHDLGKLGVSNTILDKPGRLTPREQAQVQKHPEYTASILEQVGAFQQLSRIAAGHHERLDGRGYHEGIAGDQIAWATRILTVADIYEAMSARRPYREALDWEVIRTNLRNDAGTGVDPDCLRALELWHEQCALLPRVDAQLAAVECACSPVEC